MIRLLRLFGICSVCLLAVSGAFAAAAAPDAASVTEPPKIALPGNLVVEPVGFAQFWYQHDGDETKAAQDQLTVARIRPGLTSMVYPKLRLFLLTEFGDLNPNGAGRGSLLDAHATYKVADQLFVRVGQDWYRFGQEATWTLFEMPFVQRSEIVDATWLKTGRNGLFGYDRGIFLFGKERRLLNLGYAVSVTGGAGLNAANDNKQFDFVGRVFLEPLAGMRLGASGFHGTSRISSSVNPVFKLDLPEDSWAFEFQQRFGRWARVFGEYMASDYEGNGAHRVKGVRQNGWYAALGVHPCKRVELLVRRAEFNADRFTPNSSLNTTTFGITYTLNGFNNLRFNYLIRNPQSNYAAAAGVAAPKDFVVVQWQLYFFPADFTKMAFEKPFATWGDE